jgi:peptide-methionine (R)-S-oxide reductase
VGNSGGTVSVGVDMARGAGGTAENRKYPIELTPEQWRERLSPQEYAVLREAGTERAFTGEYWDTDVQGVYSCRACGSELFRSSEKFDSHCGWPSFFAPLAEDRVEYLTDTTLGMPRTEVRCANCGSHLGHVFEGEGYPTPTDQRYCINSISIRLQTAEPGQPG